MTYIQRHWQGLLPLWKAFWINFIVVNVGVFSFFIFEPYIVGWLDLDFLRQSRLYVAIFVFVLLILFPWQLVGLWRTTASKDKFINIVLKGLIIVFLALIVSIIVLERKDLKSIFQFALTKDDLAYYSLNVSNNQIHMSGSFGFGLTKDIKKLMRENPSIQGIVLESNGGRIYEGEQLGILIQDKGLDTYSYNGCASACTIAFISGKNRYLGPAGTLGFHQYSYSVKDIIDLDHLAQKQEKTKELYRKQGISESFIHQLFSKGREDLWFPSHQELLNNKVVHKILPGNVADEVDKQLSQIPLLVTLKKYEPSTYIKLRDELVQIIAKGGTLQQIAERTQQHMDQVFASALLRTSDDAFIAFFKFNQKVLARIKQSNPKGCLSFSDPNVYGNIDIIPYLGQNGVAEILKLKEQILIDSYERHGPPINEAAAISFKKEVLNKLGDKAKYLSPDINTLKSQDDYLQSCDAIQGYFDIMLQAKPEQLGNYLRYNVKPKK